MVKVRVRVRVRGESAVKTRASWSMSEVPGKKGTRSIISAKMHLHIVRCPW